MRERCDGAILSPKPPLPEVLTIFAHAARLLSLDVQIFSESFDSSFSGVECSERKPCLQRGLVSREWLFARRSSALVMSQE